MMRLGELTRLYQAALEERRLVHARAAEDDDAVEHINHEVARARADVEAAWIEACCG